MSLLLRYLFKEYIKILILFLFLFLFFFVVIDFFEKLPTFLKKGVPFFYFLEYLFWKAPSSLYQIYPYSVALSAPFSLFFLSRSRELLALISLGITRKEIYKKYLLLLFIFSLLGGLLWNYFFPYSFYRALYIWETKIEGRKAEQLIFGNTLFFEGENFFLIATPLEPKGEYLADFSLFILKDGVPERLIIAKKALYKGDNLWEFEEAILQERGEDFRPHLFKTLRERLPIKPKTFVTIEKSVKFATFTELKQRLSFLRKVGRPQTEVLAELLNRFFYLFLGFILGVIPLWYYLREYTPQSYGKVLLMSLLLFLLLSSVFLTLQILLYKNLVVSLLLYISLYLSTLFFLKFILFS
ncbi:MAG: LptF/LptG family permease [Caldimicrobium sp.]